MENEGIMALPQGAAMPEDQGQMPMVTSADAYDAAQTAMGMVNPEELAVLKESLRQNMAELELTPSQLETLVEIFEYVSQNPGEYRTIRQELISQDFVDPEDLPEDYDPEFLGAMLVVLNELKMTAAQGANAAMMEGPPVEGMGMQPMAMAEGGLADMAALLAAQGRNGDKMLAHITPEEAEFLRERGGSGTINPATGLPEFFLKAIFKAVKSVVKSVVNVVKKVVKSPVGRILGTIALATVLGPAGVGLSMGTAAGLAGAGTTLVAGGSMKEALISGAMGYIGGGGTIMGASPVSAVGGYLPGAAGSALNTGLATGVIGAGVGKLGGMSTQDALRMGLTSGASAAALTGLSNAQQQQAGRDAQFRSDYAGAGPGAGTAQDLLNAQAPGGAMPADYQSDFYRSIGIDPATMSPAGAGGSPTNIQIERGSLGMTGMADTARQAMSEPFNVAKDLYNTNLSPSRPGLPANAGIMQKYGPLALAGTAAMAATGGMEGEPANQNPAFNRDYTGMDYIRDNPNMFQGGLDTS